MTTSCYSVVKKKDNKLLHQLHQIWILNLRILLLEELLFFYSFSKNFSEDTFDAVKGPCKAGLGNVRPAGHMRPAKHLNVAREHLFRLIED